MFKLSYMRLNDLKKIYNVELSDTYEYSDDIYLNPNAIRYLTDTGLIESLKTACKRAELDFQTNEPKKKISGGGLADLREPGIFRRTNDYLITVSEDILDVRKSLKPLPPIRKKKKKKKKRPETAGRKFKADPERLKNFVSSKRHLDRLYWLQIPRRSWRVKLRPMSAKPGPVLKREKGSGDDFSLKYGNFNFIPTSRPMSANSPQLLSEFLGPLDPSETLTSKQRESVEARQKAALYRHFGFQERARAVHSSEPLPPVKSDGLGSSRLFSGCPEKFAEGLKRRLVLLTGVKADTLFIQNRYNQILYKFVLSDIEDRTEVLKVDLVKLRAEYGKDSLHSFWEGFVNLLCKEKYKESLIRKDVNSVTKNHINLDNISFYLPSEKQFSRLYEAAMLSRGKEKGEGVSLSPSLEDSIEKFTYDSLLTLLRLDNANREQKPFVYHSIAAIQKETNSIKRLGLIDALIRLVIQDKSLKLELFGLISKESETGDKRSIYIEIKEAFNDDLATAYEAYEEKRREKMARRDRLNMKLKNMYDWKREPKSMVSGKSPQKPRLQQRPSSAPSGRGPMQSVRVLVDRFPE